MAAELIILVLILVAGAMAIVVMLCVGLLKVAFRLIGAVIRGIAGIGMCRPALPVTLPGRCRRQGCGAGNPPTARFCRRCGATLAARPAHVPVRRAAMW